MNYCIIIQAGSSMYQFTYLGVFGRFFAPCPSRPFPNSGFITWNEQIRS